MQRSVTIIFFLLSSLHAQDAPYTLFRLKPDQSSRGTFSVQVVNKAGETMYRIEREQFPDAAPPSVHLFGNGSLLLMDGYAGVLEYYDGSGAMTHHLLLRNAVKPEHERVIAWSGAASAIAMAISEPNEGSVLILLLDDRGRLLTDKSLEGRAHASGIVLSSDGSLLAAGSYRWEGTSLFHSVDFLSSDGTILSSGRAEMKNGVFSPNRALFLAAGISSAAILEVSTGNEISAKQFGPGAVIHDAVWDGTDALIAASPKPAFEEREWVYPSLTLVTFSRDDMPEQETIQQSFRHARFQREGTAIVIDLDGRPLKRGEH